MKQMGIFFKVDYSTLIQSYLPNQIRKEIQKLWVTLHSIIFLRATRKSFSWRNRQSFHQPGLYTLRPAAVFTNQQLLHIHFVNTMRLVSV
jgi:hypothetical protein